MAQTSTWSNGRDINVAQGMGNSLVKYMFKCLCVYAYVSLLVMCSNRGTAGGEQFRYVVMLPTCPPYAVVGKVEKLDHALMFNECFLNVPWK